MTWVEVGAVVVMSVWRIMKSINDGVEAGFKSVLIAALKMDTSLAMLMLECGRLVWNGT